MSKIKVLIDQNKFEDLITFIERHQKKFKIPVEMIADFFVKKAISIMGDESDCKNAIKTKGRTVFVVTKNWED